MFELSLYHLHVPYTCMHVYIYDNISFLSVLLYVRMQVYICRLSTCLLTRHDYIISYHAIVLSLRVIYN